MNLNDCTCKLLRFMNVKPFLTVLVGDANAPDSLKCGQGPVNQQRPTQSLGPFVADAVVSQTEEYIRSYTSAVLTFTQLYAKSFFTLFCIFAFT